jgi:hypothetical protein
MTCISKEIHFRISRINCPNQVWNKLKFFFYKIHKSQVLWIEKELISLNPHILDRVEYYLAHVKELQLKLGECGKDFLENVDYLIELILMNLKTPYGILC